jgi:hypothetical protein
MNVLNCASNGCGFVDCEAVNCGEFGGELDSETDFDGEW